MSRHVATLAGVLSILVVGAASCASLGPPVDFEASSASAPTAPRTLRVDPVEGRPQGLILRVRYAKRAPEKSRLELLRRVDDTDFKMYRSVRLDDDQRSALSADGVQFLDRSAPTDVPLAYRARLRLPAGQAPDNQTDTPPAPSAGTVAMSAPLRLRRPTPPGPPAAVDVASRVAGRVEIRWRAPADTGAVIFRRNIADPSARPTRRVQLGPAAGGVFVDHQVTPGGVYAYQVSVAAPVALASRAEDTLQFGRPSKERYVTVRSAPEHHAAP